MANAFLEFELQWREVPTTCEPCAVCSEIIYGKQYQLFTEPGGAMDTILCQPCYSAIQESA